jgi:hypothetical protein
MNTTSSKELKIHDLIIVNDATYSIVNFSTCKPYCKEPSSKKIGIQAVNKESNKKIYLVYPETYTFILENDGIIHDQYGN